MVASLWYIDVFSHQLLHRKCSSWCLQTFSMYLLPLCSISSYSHVTNEERQEEIYIISLWGLVGAGYTTLLDRPLWGGKLPEHSSLAEHGVINGFHRSRNKNVSSTFYQFRVRVIRSFGKSWCDGSHGHSQSIAYGSSMILMRRVRSRTDFLVVQLCRIGLYAVMKHVWVPDISAHQEFSPTMSRGLTCRKEAANPHPGKAHVQVAFWEREDWHLF